MTGSSELCSKSNSIEKVGKNCTGCGACEASCPFNAISFARDIEGFDVPVVDVERCTNCGACLNRCHAYSGASVQRGEKAYMGYSLNKDRRKSSSGGAFLSFAEVAFRENEAVRVYGSAFDEAGCVVHGSVNNMRDVARFQGSKYVQSSTVGIYVQVASDLKAGCFVLFSGCPCQVAGLYSFLGKRPKNLVTVDLVCHGVPSPGYWEKHVASLAKGAFRSASFRTKSYADKNRYLLRVKSDGKSIRRNPEQDLFFNAFMKGLDYRESCYTCPYASLDRPGDITIGDCASSALRKDYYPWEQMSFIMPNTDRGRKFWEAAAPSFEFCEINVETESKLNHQLSEAVDRPEVRDSFYIMIAEGEHGGLEKRFTVRTCGVRFALKRMVKILVPNRIRGILTKMGASCGR